MCLSKIDKLFYKDKTFSMCDDYHSHSPILQLLLNYFSAPKETTLHHCSALFTCFIK